MKQKLPVSRMLISDKKKFIFVHIEKTAGTSITSALKPYSIKRPSSKLYSVLRIMELPKDYRRYRFPKHCGLCEAQKMMPAELYNKYFKFAFVRNPWDRLVSEYNAAIAKNRRHRHRRIKAMRDFSNYVSYEIKRNKLAQLPKLVDQHGNMGLDFAGRFETLHEDFNHICNTLGIDIVLQKLNAFDHPDYREYYTDGTRERVRRHWAQDIEAFNYKF